MRKSNSRPMQLALVVFASAAFMAPFILWVWGHLRIIETGYDIESLATRYAELQHENRSLRLARARLLSLDRIEAEARKLGLRDLPLDRLLLITARSDAPATITTTARTQP